MATVELSQAEAMLEAMLDDERARIAPPENFPSIPVIPGCRYIEEEMLALEQEKILKAIWLCVGDTSDLSSPGDYRLFTRSGAPILLVRGKDQVLRAFYNTCRHRGAPVVRDETGNSGLLRCQYHSWSYGLDGRLIGVPDERDFIGLDKCAHSLVALPCHEWAGLAFVSENPDVAPFEEQYGPLLGELAWLEEGELRLVDRTSYLMECNWKAAMDAFLEVYHVNTVHPGSGALVYDSRASVAELLRNGHSRMTMRRSEEGLRRQAALKVPFIKGVPDFYIRNNVSYSLFPNAVLLAEPMGLFLQLFWPDGIGRTRMDGYFFGRDWQAEPRPRFWDSYLPIMDRVVQEDVENLAPMQFSMGSGAFKGVMTNFKERRIYWFHEEVDRAIGSVLPARYSVSRIMEPFSAAYPIPHSAAER